MSDLSNGGRKTTATKTVAKKAAKAPATKAPAAKTAESKTAEHHMHVSEKHLPDRPRHVALPALGWKLPLPTRAELPFVAGIVAVAALELIEWPVAAIIIVGHTLASHSRNESIRELAEGIEAGV